MCLSRGLDITGRREIGLYLLGSDKSLVLGNGTTLVFLSAVGKMFCSMHRLYTYVSDSTIYGRAILSSYGEILSGPIDFLILSVVMNLATVCVCV